MYILPLTFSDHFFVPVRFQVLLFVQLRRFYSIESFFRGTLGYSAAREQETGSSIYKYLASRITIFGLL